MANNNTPTALGGFFLKSKPVEQHVLGADSGTATFNLDRSGYLQGLNIRVQNTNGATSNTGNNIEESITEVEIIANGLTVFKMAGEELRKIAMPDIGRFPAYFESQNAAAVQWMHFPIKFGRDKNDKRFILPAWKFTTLQLKITWSFTDSGTTGYATSETNAKVDVIANYLHTPVRMNTPFLKTTEIYSKTLSTIQTEEVEIPVGSGNGSYRRFFIFAYEAGIEDGVDINKYELILNNAQTLINERWDTSQAEDIERYDIDSTKSVVTYVAAASATDWNCKIGKIKAVQTTGTVADKLTGVDALAGDKVSFDSENTASEAVYTTVHSAGLPFGTIIDLGTDDINQSLDVSRQGVSSLKLKLNVAAAGALTKVIAEQAIILA